MVIVLMLCVTVACAGTYDVQAVSLAAVSAGSVRVSCSFLANSSARGCRVTFCKLEVGEMSSPSPCKEIELSLDSPTSIVMGLPEGVYKITRVADVEEDGNLSVLSDVSPLVLLAISVMEPDMGTTIPPLFG